jgi:hypothetical protein
MDRAMTTLSQLFTASINWASKVFSKLYRFKINFIRKYPVISAYVAFLEGVVIGIIIYHYFFQSRFSCCIELGN